MINTNAKLLLRLTSIVWRYCSVVIVNDWPHGWLHLLRLVVVDGRMVDWAMPQNVIGKQPPEQHNVDNPHDDDRWQQHAKVERGHSVSVDEQSVADEYHAERKAAQNKRGEVH